MTTHDLLESLDQLLLLAELTQEEVVCYSPVLFVHLRLPEELLFDFDFILHVAPRVDYRLSQLLLANLA